MKLEINPKIETSATEHNQDMFCIVLFMVWNFCWMIKSDEQTSNISVLMLDALKKSVSAMPLWLQIKITDGKKWSKLGNISHVSSWQTHKLQYFPKCWGFNSAVCVLDTLFHSWNAKSSAQRVGSSGCDSEQERKLEVVIKDDGC